MKKKNFKNIIGLTLVEILIGICITTIMMGAMYTSYNVVNQSYSRVTEKAKISRASRDLVTMLMRDIRMAGFKYYAGQQQINDFAIATTGGPCSSGVSLTRLSNLFFENGFDDPKESHNPVVIRKNTLGRNATSSEASTTCCDQIQIVYEDFNQNHLFQPFKDIESHTMQNQIILEALQFGNVLRVILKKDHGLPNLTIVHLVSI